MCKRNRPFTAEELWTLIENKLVDDGDALGLDKLRAIPGITDHDWEIFQRQKGCGPLPSDLKDFFAIHDGGYIAGTKERKHYPCGLIGGFFCFNESLRHPSVNQLVNIEDEDQSFVELGQKDAKPQRIDPAWILLMHTSCLQTNTNGYIFMDCKPDQDGRRFRIIFLDMIQNVWSVVANSWTEFLTNELTGDPGSTLLHSLHPSFFAWELDS